MALRKIGNYWHCYFRDLDGKLRTLSTRETDKVSAARFERSIMENINAKRSRRNLMRFLSPEEREKAERVEAEVKANSATVPTSPRNGLKLSAMFDIASKYRKLSITHQRAWNRFVQSSNVKYAKEVTPQIALQYLQENFGQGNGKSFNNNKTYLNTIFKLCLIEGNIQTSPFENVQNMRLTGMESHRPITAEEFLKLFSAAREPWKTAMFISWHTGLRKSDCFTLCWKDIHSDCIMKVPKKTSRYNRSVYIPLHEELKEYLQTFCPQENRNPSAMIFAAYFPKGYKEMPGNEQRYIANLFSSCGIKDTKNGKASFHSIRASFITRCEQAGIPRSAIRSIVGHTSDTTTDTYSQDRETPKQILALPSICKKVCK